MAVEIMLSLLFLDTWRAAGKRTAASNTSVCTAHE